MLYDILIALQNLCHHGMHFVTRSPLYAYLFTFRFSLITLVVLIKLFTKKQKVGGASQDKNSKASDEDDDDDDVDVDVDEKDNKDEEIFSSSSSSSSIVGSSSSSSLEDRWDAANKLEIRLDATLVSCHTLARFLSYDMTLPKKEIPGFEIADVVMILDTLSSAVVLSIFWTLAGLVTQIFEEEEEGVEEKSLWASLQLVVQTSFLAAPPWLLLELGLGWPAAEGATAIERIVVGTLGLMATMSLSRFVPKFLR